MIDARLKAPGLYFESVKGQTDIDTLRTDIAGFAGPTERGPVARLIRIEGWRDYVIQFGGETSAYDTPYCVRGYFENGGQVAYIVRVLGPSNTVASAEWKVGGLDPVTSQWATDAPAAGGFVSSRYHIQASSPGEWANGMRITIEYLLRGRNDAPQLTIKAVTGKGEIELLNSISPAALEQQVEERSNLFRITASAGYTPADSPHQGPLWLKWDPIELKSGNEQLPRLDQYNQATDLLLAEPEAALVSMPDMYRLEDSNDAPYRLLARVAARADAKLDRQVIVALPGADFGVNEASQWVELQRRQLAGSSARSVAAYQPWLEVEDPRGGVIKPLREIPPVGHVAGLISRLDRDRGAHHTPANAILFDAVDTSRTYDAFDQGVLVENGLNPVRCRQGRGLEVWGGRTLASERTDPEGLYLAHRRLIHRLVRAIRRVAEPLVFDNNGPQMRLMLVRAITTVLLQAYRAGALKGERPEQAFRVVCDETNNPPGGQDLGLVQCDILLAPAVPMEFITLRIAISSEGRLEVINA